jgi:tetratricopeptide (TPR) repeat protein
MAFQRVDYAAAVNFLLQAIKEDNKPDLHFLLGEAYRLQNKPSLYKDALQSYEAAMQADARFAPPYLGRARMRLVMNPDSPEMARIDLEKAVALDPNYFEAFLELATWKIVHKDPAGAQSDLDTASRLQPASPMTPFLRARAYLGSGQADLGAAEARKAIQLDVTMLPAYRLLGECLRASGSLAQALAPLQTYTKYNSDDSEALTWLGQAYQAANDPANAIASLDRALALDDKAFEPRVVRAVLFLEQGEIKKAQDDLRIASQLKPNTFVVYLNQGRAAFMANTYNDAVRLLTGAQSLASNDGERAQALYWRAQSFEANKQIALALGDWNELLRLPAKAVPADMLVAATQHVQALASPTPTLARTQTFTPSATAALSATVTPTPTPTSTPTPAP